jgi:hypothetical protein
MSSIDIHTTLLQADWRACLSAWTERARGPATSWKDMLWWSVRRFQQPSAPDEAGIVLGPVTLRFDSAGIGVRQGLLHAIHVWSSVREGTATADHLFLWLEQSSVIIVPVRSLPSGVSVTEFQARLAALHDAALRRPNAAISSALPESQAAVPRMAAAGSLVES